MFPKILRAKPIPDYLYNIEFSFYFHKRSKTHNKVFYPTLSNNNTAKLEKWKVPWTLLIPMSKKPNTKSDFLLSIYL